MTMRLNQVVKFFVLFVVASTSLDAQYYSFGQHYDYAEESFENGEYLLAMEHYDKALALKDRVSKEFIYNYAEAAYKTYSLSLAEQLYKRYIEFEDVEDQSDALFKIAEIRQLQGRYEEAILDYNIYLSEYADVDSTRTEVVKFLKSSAQWAVDAEVESVVDSLVHLPDSINSKYSEYAPFEHEEILYYNSLNLQKESDDGIFFQSRIYKKGSIYNIPGLDDRKLISHPSFSSDGKYLFYTVGDYERYDNISCDIHFSVVNEDGTLGDSRSLGPFVNQTGSTSTHPMVTMMDSSYVLYFVSDRAGGNGGMDIYRIDLDKEMKASNLKNMNSINSAGDEMSPFYHERSNTLYFSSDGREGYGGFDVYKTNDFEVSGGEIFNLGEIINSPHNDLFFFISENGSDIYLSSNRPGSNYLEDKYETCCYDIYQGELRLCTIDLLALTIDSGTNEPLNGCRLEVIEVESGKTVFNELADLNTFELDLDCEKEYKIIASKPSYEDAEILFAGNNVVYGGKNEMTRKLYLKPAIFDLQVSVFDLDTKRPLDSLDFVLTNLTTGDVKEIKKHPSNVITFDVLPGTKYELKVNRRGYVETIEPIIIDTEGPINKDIYLKEKEIIRKAKVSLANAIPVALFFDHDSPGKNTMETTSPETFTSAYYKYFNSFPTYEKNYANRLFTGAKRSAAIDELNTFFNNEVKKGFDKYEVFKNQLILVLESGQKVNIYLRGYTSPIAPSEYNIALGKRRIDSVRREFDEWGNGALLPYIRTGQLTITERSFGEETSPTTISDDPKRPSQSIYSPSASRERRVEIDEINFNQDK